jgi:hypothetical protein
VRWRHTLASDSSTQNLRGCCPLQIDMKLLVTLVMELLYSSQCHPIQLLLCVYMCMYVCVYIYIYIYTLFYPTYCTGTVYNIFYPHTVCNVLYVPSQIRKVFRPLDFFHILERYNLILQWIIFNIFIINLHTILHNDKVKTGFLEKFSTFIKHRNTYLIYIRYQTLCYDTRN